MSERRKAVVRIYGNNSTNWFISCLESPGTVILLYSTVLEEQSISICNLKIARTHIKTIYRSVPEYILDELINKQQAT